jgi:hypothetical protein
MCHCKWCRGSDSIHARRHRETSCEYCPEWITTFFIRLAHCEVQDHTSFLLTLSLCLPRRLEKELRKQTKLLVEIRMSYPLPLANTKKQKPKWLTASLDLTLGSSSNPTTEHPSDGRPSAHVTFSSPDDLSNLNPVNNCERLVELIKSVLGSSEEENQAATSTTRNPSDVHIYVRRKGDFQVRNRAPV